MDTLGFLQRVLPSRGTYCGFTLTGKRNRFFSDIADLVNELLAIDQRGQDTYFAISSFSDDSSRRNTNVEAVRVITIDVDCGEGKPYASWKEGLKALGAFIDKLKLPKPLIVRSGNGLHVYWVLERDLTRDEWSPLARAMKEAATSNRFEIDLGKTADASAVLRPVGTYNYKDPTRPKPVKVLLDGGDTTVEAVRKALSYYYVPSTAVTKSKTSSLRDSLAVQADFPPAIGSLIVNKCAQVKWAVENQESVPEPLWYALMGVAAFCENPEETATRWSENHPGYSETTTLAKLNQWRARATGPTTCSKFEAERPAGCKGCPLAGKITSPAALGVRHQEIDTSQSAPKEAVTMLPLPKPFSRTDKGIMATIDDVQITIAPFDLYPLGYGYDEHLGYEVAQFMWDRPHAGWKVLTFRQAYLADGTYREFVNAIADQGIVLESKKQTEYFQIMLRSYMNELRKSQAMTNHYATMGWKEDNKVFVLGDDLFRYADDGSVSKDTIRLATHVSRAGSDMYTVQGSYDTWKAGTAVLCKGKLYAHQFSIGLAFASVLMQFTGLKGATVSLYGPSGTGKSLAQLMQQSVWGDPEKLHFQSKFTANSLFNRFGLAGNLPMTIDEATQMTDRDIGDYLYWVSQGRDKARLTRSAEERAPKEWALLSTLSTNKAVSAKLLSRGAETDAQLARLLELRVAPSPVFSKGSDAGRKLYHLFTTNYGHAGRDFITRIMELGESACRAMIQKVTDEFPERHGKQFDGVERYWEATLVLVELCLGLTYDWGITAFGSKNAMGWAIGQLDTMRDVVTDNHQDNFDLLARYINEHLANTLVVHHQPGKEPQPANYDNLPRGPIWVRIDGYRRKNSDKLVGGTILLERSNFRKWFAEQGGNPREFVEQITEDGMNKTPPTSKASLGKHTPLSPPQCYVIGVDMNHPRLESLLEGIEREQDNLLMDDVIDITARRGR